MRLVMGAYGYDAMACFKELGFREDNTKTWERIAEKLGVDYSIIQTSNDVLYDLFGECMLDRNLKALMAIRGLSRKEVAEKVGISERTLDSYTAGRRTPSPFSLKDLGDFFRIPPIKLLYGKLEIKFVLKHEKENEPKGGME